MKFISYESDFELPLSPQNFVAIGINENECLIIKDVTTNSYNLAIEAKFIRKCKSYAYFSWDEDLMPILTNGKLQNEEQVKKRLEEFVEEFDLIIKTALLSQYSILSFKDLLNLKQLSSIDLTPNLIKSTTKSITTFSIEKCYDEINDIWFIKTENNRIIYTLKDENLIDKIILLIKKDIDSILEGRWPI